MSEDTGMAGFDFAKFLEKFGLPTLLLLAVLYVGYSEIVKPAAERMLTMLDGVTSTNEELKTAIIEIGSANTATMKDILTRLDTLEGKIDGLQP